ncbi:PKD domain-containing protein [Candidatus Bipolaricaulota bacterium]|nr:PKD domain-containing protein [Candidatus Bipolaricaulota bacterium]
MLACNQRLQKGTLIALLLVILVSLGGMSVEVSLLSTPKDGAPGSFVTHVFGLINDSPNPETFSLSFVAPAGWGLLGAPSSIALQPNEEGTLFVTATIPAGAVAGEYVLAFTATAQSDALNYGTAMGTVLVTPMTQIELVAPTGASIAPGHSMTYEFVLINRGNVQDSLVLTASSSRGLSIALSHDSANLAPQERLPFTVQITIPMGTEPGRDVLTVVAESAIYEGVNSDAVVFTSVLPPAPDAVGGTVMEELPARIRISIDKNVMTNAFDSQLTFSTSGQILGGYFSSFFSLLDPFGPTKARISSFSMLYRLAPSTFSIGSVSQSLTDLVRLSCTGGSLKIDAEYVDLSVIGGGSNNETRFAGYLALGPDVANIGIGYLGIRDAVSVSKSLWTATAHAAPLDDWTLDIEGSLGLDGPLTSRALFFNTTIDSSGYFFSGSAYSVGTFFPGQRADSAGIEVSQRLRLTAISLSSSLSHEWDNVNRDPLLPTRIQDDLGFNLTATPLENGPTLASTLDFSWDRYADLSVKNDVDTLVAVSLTETAGVFPYSLTGKVLEQQDLVLNSHVRTTTYSQGAGLAIEAFYLYFQLTESQSFDVIADTPLSSSSDLSIRFQPETALHEASITFGNTRDDFDLSASFFIHFTDDLDVVFDGSISWDRHDANDISFGWGISFNANVNIPLPFLVTKGRIEGRAFIDRDGDGLYGLNDEPAGTIVVGAGRTQVSTNADGYFRFTPVYPGDYTLAPDQLPVNAAVGEPVTVTVIAGETLWVDIPLLPVVVITGDVFEDVDKDGSRAGDEGGLAQVRLVLESTTDGGFSDAFTDLAGRFTIADILPGTYTLSVDETSLPERFVFTTQQQVELVVGAQAALPISFGGYIREREVVITFQPPTADFFYEPETVIAGVPVTFDGTYSFDFDGTIVAFAWDFNADGVVDSTEPVVVHAFQSAGTFDIALTVLDDTGNEDTVIYPVTVGEGSAAPSSASFQPPVADFTYVPAQPQTGEIVQFNGTSSSDFDGVLSAYAWDLDGDGVSDSHEAITSKVFLMAGTYDISLTVTDNGGNSDTVTYAVVITDSARTPVIMDTPANTADETPVEPPADAPIAAQPPIASFQISPTAPSPGEIIRFNGTPSLDLDGLIETFAWDFNADGITDSTAPFAEYAFATAGLHEVTLTVTDDDGNSDSITLTVEVISPAPTPTSGTPPVAAFAYLPTKPEAGAVVLFNATLSTDAGGQIVAFAWDFNADGQTDSSAAIVDYRFIEDGVYDVSLTVTDNSGATDTLTLQVTVGAGAPETTTAPITLLPPIADFDYSPSEPQSGSVVVFNGTLSTDSDGQISVYAWDFNQDGVVDSLAAISEYAFAIIGDARVTLTVTDDSGGTDSLTRQIPIAANTSPTQSEPSLPPLSDFEYSPTVPAAGSQVLFNGLLSSDIDGDIVAYAWDFNDDGIVDSTDGFAQTVFPTAGTFNVTLTVTDDSGNTDAYTQAVFVNVASSAPPSPPSSFQPPVADFSYMPSRPSAGELVLFNGTLSWDFDGEIVAYAWDFNHDGTIDAETAFAEHIFPASGTTTVSLTVTDNSGASDTLSIPIQVE